MTGEYPVNPEYRELSRYFRTVGVPPGRTLLRSLAERYSSRVSTYFVECCGRVKIGKSENVKQRIQDMAVGSPFPPALLAAVPEYVVSEKAAQERWAHLRRHREWYEAHPDLLEWIRAELPARSRVAAHFRPRIVDACERVRLRRFYPDPLARLSRVEIWLSRERQSRVPKMTVAASPPRIVYTPLAPTTVEHNG